jgi:hypothetical protein
MDYLSFQRSFESSFLGQLGSLVKSGRWNAPGH